MDRQYTAGTIARVRRLGRIYKVFLASSLQRELEFRANFLAKIVQNIAWIIVFTLMVLVVYSHTDSVAGWNRGEAFVLAATIFMLGSASSAFFFSMTEIPEQVRRGTLDFVLTKPIDPQFWVSLRRFNFDQVGAFLAGVILLFFGVNHSETTVTMGSIAAYTVTFFGAVALYYGFSLALMTLGIWLVRVDNLWVLGETVQHVARYPLDIYQPSVQRFLTYVLPLAFLATIPSRQLVKETDWKFVALSLLYASLALVASRAFWKFATRRYSSASS
jgi:ABC-2 type transport system permease protein